MAPQATVAPQARGQGLCDIDRKIPKNIKKWEFLTRRNLTSYKSNVKTRIIGLISPFQDFPFFIFVWILLSISHFCPLASGATVEGFHWRHMKCENHCIAPTHGAASRRLLSEIPYFKYEITKWDTLMYEWYSGSTLKEIYKSEMKLPIKSFSRDVTV